MTAQTLAAVGRPNPTSTTLRALDWLNFFLSGVQAAVGPFLAIYFAGQGWSQERVGLILAVSTLAGILVQAPVGWLVDWTKSKKTLIAVAIAVIAGGSFGIAAFPVFPFIVVAQILIGSAMTVFVPTICAISLGLVGRTRFDARQGRNQAFIAAGSIASAIAAGGAAYYSSNRVIFLLVILSALPALFILSRIKSKEIDHERARESAETGQKVLDRGALAFFCKPALVVFMLSAVLLNFANAAMLPLVGEMVEQSKSKSSMLFMAACVITAQLMMMLLSPVVGRKTTSWGRRPLLLIAFGILPIRGVLYLLTSEPFFLVAIEVLDGIGSSIFAVTSVLVIADLARGTGRFNLTIGVMTMAINIGASLSQVSAGFIAHRYGFNNAFLCLAVVALVAFLNIWLFMPETTTGGLVAADGPLNTDQVPKTHPGSFQRVGPTA